MVVDADASRTHPSLLMRHAAFAVNGNGPILPALSAPLSSAGGVEVANSARYPPSYRFITDTRFRPPKKGRIPPDGPIGESSPSLIERTGLPPDGQARTPTLSAPARVSSPMPKPAGNAAG